MSEASAIVLAGGRSTRLGRDKRRLRLWGPAGPSLLEHTVALAGALCQDLVVVLNDPDEWPGLAARLVVDRWPGAGPLAGIASGLAAVEHDWALVLAADMPLLDPGLLRALLDRLPTTSSGPLGADPAVAAILPRWAGAGGFEPLHALYHRSCLPLIEARLAAGQRQVAGLLDALPIQTIAIDRADERWRRALTNLNTAADVAGLGVLPVQ